MASKPVVIKIIRRVESSIKEQLGVVIGDNSESEEDASIEENVSISELLKSKNEYINCDTPIILETKGVITDEDGEISVVYETRLDEPMPVMVTYSFNKSQRDVLTVKKLSFDEAVFFYETKRKSQWLDDVSNMINEEATCYTKTLKNYITYDNGGYIELEYYIEIGGELFEYNKEYFIVEPIK